MKCAQCGKEIAVHDKHIVLPSELGFPIWLCNLICLDNYYKSLRHKT